MYTVEGRHEEWWVIFGDGAKIYPAITDKDDADKIALLLNGIGKSVRYEQFREAVAQAVFGRTVSRSIARNRCVMCGRAADQFDSMIGMHAYAENGLCQECQNKLNRQR